MEEVFDVGGPVLAEVFVVWADGAGVQLTGPCGPDGWYIEVGEGEDPMVVVRGLTDRVLGGAQLLHSTSWRRDKSGVVLSFLAVLEDGQVGAMESVPVGRADLARGEALAAPAAIASSQVLEHALRHLAWLIQDDEVVAGTLDPKWRRALDGYVPEPFRHLS